MHRATRLHWDFRLEVDGVLKSWAVPKGPSGNPRDKRLAVMTEDHPLEYAGFEGVIPEGNYGAGQVLLWDLGTYRNDAARHGQDMTMAEALEKGHVLVWLSGHKLRGGFALIHSQMGGDPDNWLLIKESKDQEMDPAEDVVQAHPESVLSGKKIEEIK
jgi:DNA ligase D-like protein (predicted 3'-phosphoesterase)